MTTFTGASSFVSIDSSIFTTPIPFNTCPKTTCLPSKCGVGTVVMKNWEPFVLGPALAMLSKPTLSCYKDKEMNYFNRHKHLTKREKTKWNWADKMQKKEETAKQSNTENCEN